MDTFRGRFNLFIALLLVLAALVAVQLIRFQVIQHVDSKREAPELLTSEPAARGRIFDRNGYLLAADEPHFEVLFDRNGAQFETAAQQIRALKTNGNPHQILAKDLSYQEGVDVRNQDVWGFTASPFWKRVYPEGTLAAHVLGFVNNDRQGMYGLEGWYNNILSPTQEITHTDVMLAGADLVLTIDRTAQMIVEDELRRGLQDTGAKSGSIIVMNPRNGEILALATAPTFDPNKFSDVAQADGLDAFVDQAVSDNYEPGSVFKIITMAAALDSGTVTPDTVYNDTASIEVGGQVFWNWDRGSHGPTDMTGLLAKSLNVGAATLAVRMGQQTFYRYIRAFGFGQPTGIDLQHEAEGLVVTREKNPDQWSEAYLGANAFGQGIATTPIQMVSSVAAVANDGLRVQPHVVKKIIRNGQVTEAKTVTLGRPISAQTAQTLTKMLSEAVRREVPDALVDGYSIAGKTGTAQIPIPGGYDDPWSIGSFIAYAPADDPQVIILVKLDRPTSSMWGSETAVPVFHSLAVRLFPVLGVRPDAQMTMR
jgi:cell division protein FtsI/penicillin-binding protein 2